MKKMAALLCLLSMSSTVFADTICGQLVPEKDTNFLVKERLASDQYGEMLLNPIDRGNGPDQSIWRQLDDSRYGRVCLEGTLETVTNGPTVLTVSAVK
jgi:hypothetical protein